MTKFTLLSLALLVASSTAFVFQPSSSLSSLAPVHGAMTTSLFAKTGKDDAKTAVLERPTTKSTAAAVKGEEDEEELTETQILLQKVKDAGTAGFISYAMWEWAFWLVSVPVVTLGYYKVAGHWPDFSNKEDIATVSAEAFAFVNFARLAVPLRIGLALSTVPFVDGVLKKMFKGGDDEGKSDK